MYISHYDYISNIVFSIILFLTPVFFLPTAIRRLHDIGVSGWFGLLLLTPIASFILKFFPEFGQFTFIKILYIINIFLILLLLFMPGKKEKNRYGEMPIFKKRKLRIFLNIVFTLLVICYMFFMAFVVMESCCNIGPDINIPLPELPLE